MSTHTQAEEVLLAAPVAFVAMVDGGAPYVVPMNFAYSTASPGRLYLHTGAGRKTQALADDGRVCIAVTAGEAFYRGATPCQDGFAYRSVLVEGRATLIQENDLREEALRTLVAKYDPAAAELPFRPDALAETLVYAVDIDALTYRQRPLRS